MAVEVGVEVILATLDEFSEGKLVRPVESMVELG
jgi:hypothetical protein